MIKTMKVLYLVFEKNIIHACFTDPC